MSIEQGLPAAEEVTAEVTATPQFIDAGGNFESACPVCGVQITDWWADALSEAGDRQFRTLDVVTPCCGHTTTLNDLRYDWPVAFGRVSLSALNPDVTEVDPAVKRAVETALGLPTRLVYQHY